MVRALDTPDKQDLRKLQLLKDELVRFSSLPTRFALDGLDGLSLSATCQELLVGIGSVLSFARTESRVDGGITHKGNIARACHIV